MQRLARTSWIRKFAPVLAGLCLQAIVPAAALDLPDWTIANLRNHPLVGTVWKENGAETSFAALDRAIAEADHVAVGEIHDNPDHHLVQAAIVEAIVADGRKPTLVFEMIPERLNPALQDFLASGSRDSDALGTVLEWNKRGWPDWSIYGPIADAALRHDLPMIAGDLDRDRIRAVGRKGKGALDPARIARYGLDRPLEPRSQTALKKILFDGHCGLLPEAALSPMVTVQRARDGALGDAMASAAVDNRDGTVLIAGAGHVRKDWGAPSVLARLTPQAKILSIALVEVSEQADRIDDYELGNADSLPYDFVIFTPRSKREDPCVGLEKHFKKKQAE